MPRKRILKTNRVSIDENVMKRAILSVFNNTYPERRAAIIYNIKRSTLQSRIKKILSKCTKDEYLRKHHDDSGNESEESESPKYSSKYTAHQVFTKQEEDELEKYIKRSSDINYGLTYKEIQKLAYDYAKILNKSIPQQWEEDKCAKKSWRIGFMTRHKLLSLRKPESTSLSRSTAFTKHKVDQFFENYKKVLDRFQFPPERILNLDESGVTTVMKPVKIVSTCGKKQVSQVASAERGELTTFVGIINAAGQSLPPVYVFPRVRNVNEFLTGAPVSSMALGNKTGWMTSELFPEVMKHIVKQTNCSLANPILILLDNHESHVTLNTIKYCKNNGICLLSFPPHTTHRLQPLDVGVFGPFKTYCAVSFNDWLTSNPGQTIYVKNIPLLTNVPYLKAFTATNIVQSFKKTGLWPLNRLVFSDDDFAPSFVTDRPMPTNLEDNEKTERETQLRTPSPRHEIEEIQRDPHSDEANNRSSHEIPSCSHHSTPEKERLEELAREKEIRKRKCDEMKERRAIKRSELEKKKTTKKQEMFESSSESDAEMSVHDDSAEDDFSDEMEDIKEIGDQPLCLNDFVLVKFSAKKAALVHFVGQIQTIDKNGVPRIKFLKRQGLSATFNFPAFDDISDVEVDDIIAKLVPSCNPGTRAGTARTASRFTFRHNFGKLIVN